MAAPTFIRNLIKGKIAETVFESMFRECEYQVTHFGYEYLASEFIREDIRNVDGNKEVLDDIRHSPDFIVTSTKNVVNFVEVKFQSNLQHDKLLEMATKTHSRWKHAWYFVATPDGFFFGPCQEIVQNRGLISTLDMSIISDETQRKYLEILRTFLSNSQT